MLEGGKGGLYVRKFLTCLCTTLVVVLFLAPPAGAQIEFLGPPYEGVEGTQAVSSDEYIYDSGVSTTTVGIAVDGGPVSIAWFHHFDRLEGAAVLTAISTTFGTPAFPGTNGVSPGQAYQVHVWSDPNGDGNPSDAVLLASASGTVSGGSIETDVFQSLKIGPVALPPSFFIGAATIGVFPAPLDQTVNNNAQWIDFGNPPYDPTLIVGATNMDDIGIPGVWLLRGTAEGDVPAPASGTWGMIALIGLVMVGSLFFMRRRREA